MEQKLSIIIPLYNKEASILNTLDSIISQDYTNYEVIVVDDGSTDSSVAKVNSRNSDYIHLISKQNGGPSSARNYGVVHSTGDWVIFLDADDTLEPGALKHFSDIITKHEECSFFCFNHYLYDGEQKFLYSDSYKEGYVWNNFLAWNANVLMPRSGAAVFSRELILRYPFKEYLRRYEDAESLFEIMRNTKCYRDPTPVMSYNISTLEASAPRKDIKEDFIGHLSLNGKGWMEQYAIYSLYIQGLKLYPEDMRKLYSEKDFNHQKFYWIGKVVRRLKKMRLA